ncbi:hypothetical protein BH11BAC4_BH11BAC4_08180 [soil metagenome]
MFFSLRYLLPVILLTTSTSLLAQDITGTWEGRLDNSQFLQLNIIQVGDIACGYTWDHLDGTAKDYCMANFIARYDKKRKQWALTGTSFIENTGSHVLMNMRLQFDVYNGTTSIIGWESPNFGGTLLGRFSRMFEPNVFLRKVADSPSQILTNMKDCDRAKENQQDTVTVLTPNGSGLQTIPLPQNWDYKINSPEIPLLTNDSLKLVKQMEGRKNTETRHLAVNEKIISLDLYDNAVVDGDSISLFYNGKLMLSHQLLKEKALTISFTLDEHTSRHEITLFAENLGSIPPNTALVVVRAGNKRYELFASASLTENAVIVLDYSPK